MIRHLTNPPARKPGEPEPVPESTLSAGVDPGERRRALAAERARKAYERRLCGLRSYRFDGVPDLAERLVRGGFLAVADRDDADALSFALQRVLAEVLG